MFCSWLGFVYEMEFSELRESVVFSFALAVLYLSLVSEWVTEWVSATLEFWVTFETWDQENNDNDNEDNDNKDKKESLLLGRQGSFALLRCFPHRIGLHFVLLCSQLLFADVPKMCLHLCKCICVYANVFVPLQMCLHLSKCICKVSDWLNITSH